MHLDSEYRRRWELYHTKHKVYDSRITNYKEISGKAIKIEAHVEHQTYTVDTKHPGCKGLIRWRWGGWDWVDGKKVIINIWCIGWYNSKTCYMKEIQFSDGSMQEKEYPLQEFKVHL